MCVQAQYNAPANRVNAACQHLSNSSLTGQDFLTAMVQALDVFSGNTTSECLDTTSGSAEPEPERFPGSAQAPSVAASPAEAAAALLSSAEEFQKLLSRKKLLLKLQLRLNQLQIRSLPIRPAIKTRHRYHMLEVSYAVMQVTAYGWMDLF